MPNRNMQVKCQRASVQRAAYATAADWRTSYRDTDAPPDRLDLATVPDMVADYLAKTRAQTEQRRATREALGKRTVFPWTRR